jgi:hypothetical protein
MPRSSGHEHTAKADRMAEHIEKSAKKEGRYKGREKRVAWATVHKEMSKAEAHGKSGKKSKS